jgi:Fe-S-cluster-containing hydrogenase component 2
MVVSILPKDEICVSPKDLEKKQLNAVITNLLCSCVCRELKYLILKSKRIGEDARLIWKLLFELVNTKWDEIESDDEDELVEMCPTTTTTFTDHQASNPKQGEDQRSEDVVPL